MLESLFYAVVIAVVIAAYARDRLEREPDDLEALREQYATGAIDQREFDQRLEFQLDDRNEQIRHVVERVNGVGPQTSKAIAREYDSLDGLRASDQERLESVSGVGEQTAEAVLERVREN